VCLLILLFGSLVALAPRSEGATVVGVTKMADLVGYAYDGTERSIEWTVSEYTSVTGRAHNPTLSGSSVSFELSVRRGASRYDTPHLLRVSYVLNATNTPGLRVTAANPSASELRAANYLADQGESVVLRDPIGTRAGGGTSDLLVGGKAWDVYSPTTGNVDRIVSAVAKKGSQVNGGGVIIDLSGSTVTPAELANIEARLAGIGANVGKVVVIK
jgi:hypothetical protein